MSAATALTRFRMPDATYSARGLWLHLYAEGGRWSRPELIDVFGVDPAMDVDMWDMVNGRQLRRWGDGAAATFGVTGDCLVPPWITVAELQAPQQAVQHHRTHAGMPKAERRQLADHATPPNAAELEVAARRSRRMA